MNPKSANKANLVLSTMSRRYENEAKIIRTCQRTDPHPGSTHSEGDDDDDEDVADAHVCYGLVIDSKLCTWEMSLDGGGCCWLLLNVARYSMVLLE